MARVLIAGCGYVGTALGLLLGRRGHEVFGLRRDAAPLPEPISRMSGDLDLPESLPRARFDVLVFTAGAFSSDEASYRQTYLTGLSHALDAFSAARVLFTSSTAVYGQSHGEWVDESTPTEPQHHSGRIMLEAERLLRIRHPDAIVLRLGGIYGPGRSSLVNRVRRGEATYPPGDPFVNRFHRDDCAGALAHLIELERPDALYLGVDDDPATRRQVAEWIALCTGAPPPRQLSEGSARGGESNKRCSNARLRASGYTLRFPTFRDGYGALLGSEATGEADAAGPDPG